MLGLSPEDGGAHNGGGAWGAEWTARKVPASGEMSLLIGYLGLSENVGLIFPMK